MDSFIKENERLHTRLAEAERQLQYLRQLTENVDTALFVCSTDGRIDALRTMVDANLFSRPLSAYEALGRELRRYQSVTSAR